MNRRSLLVMVLLGTISAGCADRVDEPLGNMRGERASSLTAQDADAPGYKHEPAASDFFATGIVGDWVTTESPFRHIRGVDGSASVNLRNGAYLSAVDAGSSRQLAVGTKNPDEHNALVVAYFKNRGLPMDQVGGVHVTAMGVGIPTTDLAALPQNQFVAYTSHLERVVDGVRVVESVAYARIAADGRVVQEGVHWPNVPAAIRSAAASLSAAFKSGADEQFRNAALTTFPGGTIMGSNVAIHHSPAAAVGEQGMFASIDVHVRPPNGRGRTLSFDAAGNQLTLPPVHDVTVTPGVKP